MKIHGKMKNNKPVFFKKPVNGSPQPDDIIKTGESYHRIISDGNKMQMVKLSCQN